VQVHDVQYLQRFLGGALTPSEERRIGFGDTVRTPALIERTLSEVAGECNTEAAVGHGTVPCRLSRLMQAERIAWGASG